MQKLPLEEHELGLTTGLAPIVCWGFAGAAEGERGLASSVEGQYTGQHLPKKARGLQKASGHVQSYL